MNPIINSDSSTQTMIVFCISNIDYQMIFNGALLLEVNAFKINLEIINYFKISESYNNYLSI